MTCDERLEALLNRAGQTISDLPKSDGKNLTYEREARSLAEREAFAFATQQDAYVDIIDCLAMHQDYILHLTDIIDRMETALENVCGERDWLARKFVCVYCKHCENDIESEPCKSCYEEAINDPPGYEFDEGKPIVPEDWRVDDD